MSIDKVVQTNRTILFEVFNSESNHRLDTLLQNEWDNGEEVFHTILTDKDNGLCVKSFDEFLEKFKPVLYQTSFYQDDEVVFKYSIEKPTNMPYNVVDITEQNYYKMILKLYEQKGTSGINNLDFDYDEIKNILTPSNTTKEIKTIRRNLEYNYNKLLELEKQNAPASETNRYKKNIVNIRKSIINKYKDFNFLNFIPIALADTENKLNALPPSTSSKGSQSPQLKLAEYCFDANGDIKVIQKSVSNEETPIGIEDKNTSTGEELLVKQETNTALANKNNINTVASKPLGQYIENDFIKYAPAQISNNTFVKNLIISSYTNDNNNSNAVLSAEQIEQLKTQKEIYQQIYKKTQESFIKAVHSLIEKIMSVKIFFDHATEKGNLEQSDLIIANCTVDDLLDTSVKANFEKYIESMQNTPDTRIWFAIIPGLNLECDIQPDDSDDDTDIDMENLDDDIIDVDEKNSNNHNGLNLVSMNSLKSMLDILSKNNILTFFSSKGCEKTSFSRLNTNIIQNYKKSLETINNKKYSVFCYPNFTILPKKEQAVEFGVDRNNNPIRLNSNGVFIDSCYVACGMMVACQNPKFLESKGLKIKRNNACVRFDLENNKYNKIILSKMNRENLLNWSKDIKNEIERDSFGFCFCCDKVYYENNLIPNTYVYNARTLEKDDNNGHYKNIYKVLVENFIKIVLPLQCGKLTVESIQNFISNDKGARGWKKEAGEYDNSILDENEKILFDDKNKKISINFKGNELILNDITIESDTDNTENQDKK